MRILFVASRFHTNQFFAVRALQEHGNEVRFHVVTVGATEDHSLVRPELIAPSRLFGLLSRALNRHQDERFKRRFMLPSFAGYLRMFREFDPDLVIVRDPPYVPSAMAILVAKLFSKKILLYTQGPKFLDSMMLKSVERTISLALLRCGWVTPVLGEETETSTTHRRVHYLPFVVDTPAETKNNWFTGDTINVLSIGKFVPRKNHRLLLEALRPGLEEGKFSLTVIGECSNRQHLGELEALRRLVHESGLDSVVSMRTNLSFQEVQAEYLKHDVFILPSSREPAAVSILEAMARGLPVACSDSNGTRCYIRSGVNGWVFRSDSVEDLKRVAVELEDRHKLQQMGEWSVRIAREHHSARAYLSKLERIVNECYPRAAIGSSSNLERS